MKDDFMTIGKADIDMADFVDDQLCQQNRALAMQFKVGLSKPTGIVRLIITTKPLGKAGSEDDGMTEVSGVTGLTSDTGNHRKEEQDLKGELCWVHLVAMQVHYYFLQYWAHLVAMQVHSNS
jgi:hypothetical protein